MRGLKLAVSYDLGDWPVTSEVRAALADVVDTLRSAGAIVEEVDLVVERELVTTAGNAHHALGFGRDCARAHRRARGRRQPGHALLARLAREPPDPLDGLAAEVEIRRGSPRSTSGTTRFSAR